MSYVPGLAKSSILDCNRFNSMDADSLDPTTRELVKRRESCMGSSYRLFYKRPLNLVKGEGEYLWDAEGNKYLDAYNNIPSMGHSHPKIVEAVHEQMKKSTPIHVIFMKTSSTTVKDCFRSCQKKLTVPCICVQDQKQMTWL